MPYNNAPIPPPEEITGSGVLPLARVKKIIAQDEEIAQCSNSAAFAISIATEEFIRYLVERAHDVAKSERKPRRQIAYKHIATAVSRYDNLEFLADTVPKTTTWKQYNEANAQKEKEAAAATSRPASSNGVNGETASKSIDQMMLQQPPSTNGAPNGINGHPTHSPMADRTVNHSHPDPVRDLAEDTSMTG